jgi:hypothetical protein
MEMGWHIYPLTLIKKHQSQVTNSNSYSMLESSKQLIFLALPQSCQVFNQTVVVSEPNQLVVSLLFGR